MELLDGRCVVVTGAASGIGAGTVEVLRGLGARVIAVDRDVEGLRRQAVGDRGNGWFEMDVREPQNVEAVLRRIVDVHGCLDGVVHAAGIDDPDTKQRVADQVDRRVPVDTIIDVSDAQWNRMISVNLSGSFYVLRTSLAIMRDQRSGSVVLIGSETGVRGLAGLTHYAASKGGVHALVRSAAKEAAAYGVRVNGIAPGVIDTPMSRRSAGLFGGSVELSPLGRAGQPAEIGGVAAFLLSGLASYVTGEIVNVDGGRMAC